ncbi:DUF2268 domain-containing putative Zn-dependent protease [Paracoccus sp. Z330]|uniref:DUF2268 domain-containing putative Zn-dependent protease n=1 Tax=Paracoccus onchidii TaxID=3017813 RepID=A0ABT4ZHY5_9RHOB|nr:DUF2268 domain-containing putative Zn-dependent protease [Paracoccus onchidii]MDB6178917.1 DUF2268 domain-containing putative Zn-dependent protease [Paracoccus onchidii]
MTVWNIHFLNARHGLTRVLPEIREVARQAVALVEAECDLPRFDLVVKPDGGRRNVDRGPQARTPAAGQIELTLNPDGFAADATLRALLREMHHVIRHDRAGYGRSLGDALVAEGLAGHFVLHVMGGRADPRDATAPAPGLARKALNEWSRLDFDRARWFEGKGDLRKWAGYGLGHRLVADELAQQPDADVTTLTPVKAEVFRAAMRRLVSSDGPEETPEITDSPAQNAAKDAAG